MQNDNRRPQHRSKPTQHRYADPADRNIYSDSSRLPPNTRKQSRRKKKKRKKPLIITIFLASLILLVLGVGTIFAVQMMNKIDRKDRSEFKIQSVPELTEDEYVSENTTDGSNLQLSYASGSLRTNKSITNILLIGCDADDEYGYGRSDSIMLVSVDRKHNKLKMTSFLRDTYLKIPGMQDNRLNYSYACGGPGLLIETVEQNYRVKIDYYIKVNFSSFMDIIDTVGGVDINLSKDEATVLNNIYYSNKCKEGVNRLDGGYALNYARIRHLDSDFGRTQRQRAVVESLLAKFKSSSASQMINVLNQITPMIQTDMSNGDLLNFASQAPSIMQFPTSQLSLPQADTYKDAVIRNMEVLVPDIESDKNAIWEFIYDS